MDPIRPRDVVKPPLDEGPLGRAQESQHVQHAPETRAGIRDNPSLGLTGFCTRVRRRAYPRIGPKTLFFGPIPAEMGRNGPEMQASARASGAAKVLQTSQAQG